MYNSHNPLYNQEPWLEVRNNTVFLTTYPACPASIDYQTFNKGIVAVMESVAVNVFLARLLATDIPSHPCVEPSSESERTGRHLHGDGNNLFWAEVYDENLASQHKPQSFITTHYKLYTMADFGIERPPTSPRYLSGQVRKCNNINYDFKDSKNSARIVKEWKDLQKKWRTISMRIEALVSFTAGHYPRDGKSLYAMYCKGGMDWDIVLSEFFATQLDFE